MNNQLNANYAWYVCVGFYPMVWSGTQFRSVNNNGSAPTGANYLNARNAYSVCVGFYP